MNDEMISKDECMKKEDDCYLSFWSMLSSQTSSVYDFIDNDSLLNDEEAGEMLMKKKHKKPDIRPYLAINDLNNSDAEPYLNKPKTAIEAGIIVDF